MVTCYEHLHSATAYRGVCAHSKEDFTEEVALVLGFEGWAVFQP